MNKFTEFYKSLNSDETVRAEFVTAASESGAAEGTKLVDFNDEQLSALIPVAKNAGFDFTLDELKNYFRKSEDGSMSDDELEMVAGGKYETVYVTCTSGTGYGVVKVM